MIKYFCKNCNINIESSECSICGARTEVESKLYWCSACNIPIYDEVCPICGTKGVYFTSDARPVFPEERLLIEVMLGKPFCFIKDSVWNGSGNRYYINGKRIPFSVTNLKNYNPDSIRQKLDELKEQNTYTHFDRMIAKWIKANSIRYDYITSEAKSYIAQYSKKYLNDDLNAAFVSFSGGKDSTVVSDLVRKAKRFNVTPLICYSKYDWKKKFKLTLSDYKLGVIKNFCAIMVNASYSTDYVQDILRAAKGNLCIVVDEAHNFGAKRLQKCMLENFKYRLALSATLERHHDEEGTQSLYNYFKKVCITFTLEDAIKQGFLTPYYYHPVVVNLEPDELQEYTELTEKIINILRKNPGDELPKSAEMLLIKRARIIAGARNKLHILEELMEEYKHDNNILVYCGATKVFTDREDDYDEDDARQIERVVDILGNKLNMRVSMFTSKEDANIRSHYGAASL